jgi:hypothetical protein
MHLLLGFIASVPLLLKKNQFSGAGPDRVEPDAANGPGAE